MNKKLKIVFIVSWYPDKISKFNGDFIRRHAQAVALYADVSVIHVVASDEVEKFSVEETYLEGVREIIVYHKKVHFPVGFIRDLLNLFVKFKGFKLGYGRVEKPDLVHLNILFPAGIFARYLRFKYGIPYIVSEHWSKFLPESGGDFSLPEKMIIRSVMRRASLICPVSENLLENLSRITDKVPYKVIPNVADTRIFHPQVPKSRHTGLRFIHVSGMNDGIKNISGIIRAVRQVYSVRQDFTISFVGSEDTSRYERMAKESGIPPHVIHFMGIVPYEEVANLMRRHDVLLMFSNYENLPCVIIEALVSGLPVISSRVGGIAELVDEHNGILVEKGDVDALARKMIDMIEHFPQYDLTRIAAQAREKYSYKTVGKAFWQEYVNILQGKEA